MFLRSVSIYFVFNVISSLLPILTLPIFTRYLSPADYGTLAMFTIITMFAGNFMRMEINSALKREYASSEETFPVHISTAFIFSNILLFVVTTIFVLLLPFFPEVDGISRWWLFGILIIAYLRIHSVVLHHLLQLNNRALLFSIWGLVVSLGTYGIAISLLVTTSLTWESRAWAELVVALVAFPASLYFLRKDYHLAWRFNYTVLKSMLRFSFPLLVTSMITYTLATADRIFIANLVGTNELGLYTVAIQISAAMGLFFSTLLPAWESWIFIRKKGVRKDNIRKILFRFALITLASACLCLILPPVLRFIFPYLTNKNFAGGEAFLGATLVSASAAGLFSLLAPLIVYHGKTTLIAVINLFMLAISLVCLYFFIKIWGTVGAPYAITFTYSLGILLMIFFVIKNTYANAITTRTVH